MIKQIGVVGLGTMGRGIIETFAKNNIKVIGINMNPVSFDNNSQKLINQLYKKNLLDIKSNITLSKDIEDINKCDLIIESVSEDFSVKQRVLNKIQNINDSCILATNTSSLSINSLKNNVNKENFIGLHFFNPAPIMKLVEVVKSNDTSTNTVDKCIDLINSIDYKPILCNDSEGFIVNKLLIPQIMNAILLYSKNVSSITDIDNAIIYGLGHPMGPFKLSDFIGNDIVLSIFKNINKYNASEYQEAINLLEEMVKNNKLGKKSGEGFHNWKK